jgi:hypothetical protein
VRLPSKWRRTSNRWLDRIDDLLAGRWYWQALRWIREWQLEKELITNGDRSMETRIATEQVRRMHFASEYWGSAPGPVMQVAREANARGVPRDDIKLLVLNRDLRLQGSQVAVRRSTFIQVMCRILSAVFNALLITHFVLLCALIVLEHGPSWLKTIVLCVATLLYTTFVRGWALYTSRALHALSRSGDAVAAISEECAHVLNDATVLVEQKE